MISNNRNVSLETVDFSFYIRRIALKEVYRKEKTDKLAYTPMEYTYLETPA